jgi:hypothetical protein
LAKTHSVGCLSAPDVRGGDQRRATSSSESVTRLGNFVRNAGGVAIVLCYNSIVVPRGAGRCHPVWLIVSQQRGRRGIEETKIEQKGKVRKEAGEDKKGPRGRAANAGPGATKVASQASDPRLAVPISGPRHRRRRAPRAINARV